MHRFLLVLALAATAACSGDDAAPATDGDTSAGATPSASASSGDGDLADIGRYELTMARIDQFYAAQRNVALAAQAMSPEERAALRNEDENDESDENDVADLDEMARRIEGNAAMAKAVRDAGLSPREFATLTMAMLQSAMASQVIKMRPEADADSLAREMQANPANVRFMVEHEAELNRKQAEFQAEMQRLGVSQDG